ncbi:uncharacterized protein PV09_06884 [Verruconis gallopava]|uniref:Uncharacterized protein n=1 Tax=Verruconis gallopava TaxID=253628 RepID=A0A0D1XHJ5_9PEZI|nr:uncharacterized protein PV09_06884 [Verruconis gallopava]KIW01706.1 hypothetical protein PV09_06884 [Verruconis gallopava]
MRETMRNGSVNRKPRRNISEVTRSFRLQHARNDLLLSSHPLSERASPLNDAASAAQAAQAWFQQTKPSALAPRHCKASTGIPTLPSLGSMGHDQRRGKGACYEVQPLSHGSESVQLGPMDSGSSRCRRSDRSELLTCGNSRQGSVGYVTPSRSLYKRLKEGLNDAFWDYRLVWSQRKNHVSDEHLGMQAIFDYAVRRWSKAGTASPSLSRSQTSNGPECAHNPADAAFHGLHLPAAAAWPTGDPTPTREALKQRSPHPFDPLHRDLEPPQPAFVRGRVWRQPSVITTQTAETSWTDVQRAVQAESSPTARTAESRTLKDASGTVRDMHEGKIQRAPRLALVAWERADDAPVPHAGTQSRSPAQQQRSELRDTPKATSATSGKWSGLRSAAGADGTAQTSTTGALRAPYPPRSTRKAA